MIQDDVRQHTTTDISAAQVETILNTIVALESGKGPKPATTTTDYYGQISRFSGQPYSIVEQVVPAYVATLSGMGSSTSESKEGPTSVKEPTTSTSSSGAAAPSSQTDEKPEGSKRGLIYAIGGLLGLLTIIAFVAKKRTQR